jgi:flagellar biosynthesis/type III secretory pathway protein FliH
MPILSHVERRAMEAVCKEFFPEGFPEGFPEDFQKAFQKGFQEGYQQGLQEGLQNCRKMVLTVLKARFNPVPAKVIDRINQISDYETLQQLLKRGISIGSLAEFEEVLASIMTDH